MLQDRVYKVICKHEFVPELLSAAVPNGGLYLVWILHHVVETDEASDELTVEEVVGGVNGAHTPVRVVVRVRAEAEWSI